MICFVIIRVLSGDLMGGGAGKMGIRLGWIPRWVGGGDGIRYKPIGEGKGKKLIPAAGMGMVMPIPAPPRPICIPNMTIVFNSNHFNTILYTN